MMLTVIVLGSLAAVVGVIFLFVWKADANRAEKVENDEERLDTDNEPPVETETDPDQPHLYLRD